MHRASSPVLPANKSSKQQLADKLIKRRMHYQRNTKTNTAETCTTGRVEVQSPHTHTHLRTNAIDYLWQY